MHILGLSESCASGTNNSQTRMYRCKVATARVHELTSDTVDSACMCMYVSRLNNVLTSIPFKCVSRVSPAVLLSLQLGNM